jgi:hypothetical protein
VLTEPTLVETDEAAAAFPPILRWMMRMAGVTRIIRLRRTEG